MKHTLSLHYHGEYLTSQFLQFCGNFMFSSKQDVDFFPHVMLIFCVNSAGLRDSQTAGETSLISEVCVRRDQRLHQ